MSHLTNGNYTMIHFYKSLTPYNVALFASMMAFLGVVFFQYYMDLAPCKLCIQQRYGWGVAFTFALIGFVFDRPYGLKSPWLTRGLVLAILGGIAWSGTIAFIHMGVQFNWFTWESSCTTTAELNSALSMEELKKQLFATPVAKCDEIEWDLWGWVTIPVLNLILCIWAFAESITSTTTIKSKILKKVCPNLLF